MEHILYQVADHIATITLNRPQALNALNLDMVRELTQAIEDAPKDPDVYAVLLNSSLEKAFTAGGDIKYESRMTQAEAVPFAQTGKALMAAMETCAVPVIMAVDGYALGGGAEMMLVADIVVAARTAKIGIPTINLGSVTAWGATQRLVAQVGWSNAMDLLATGRIVAAEEAQRMGLVQYVVDREDLQAKAREVAATVADKVPLAMRKLKQAMRKGLSLPLAEGLEMENQVFASCCAIEDRAEAMAAFLEKRPHKPYQNK